MTLNLKIKTAASGLVLKDILPPGLEQGMYDDAFRLQETDSSTSAIVFDPKHIGRGINVEISEDGVALGLLLPAGPAEVELLYRILKRAMKKLGAGEFYKCGEIGSADGSANGEKAQDAESAAAGAAVFAAEELETSKAEDLEASGKALAEINEKLASEKNTVATLFSALNPITLSADDVAKMEGKIKKLQEFLHEKQSEKAYYSAPQFFQDPADGSFVGVYTIMHEMITIMPFEPALPFYMEGELDRWYVYVYISDEKFGYVKFDDFIKKAPRNGLYDATHFFCTLTEDMAEQLIKNYGNAV